MIEEDHKMKHRAQTWKCHVPASAFALIGLLAACGSDEPASVDTDLERETASFEESDEGETEGKESDSNTACLASITGKVVFKNGTSEAPSDPVPVSIAVCIGVCFDPITTDDDGAFTWRLPLEGDMHCVPYDFASTPIHIDFRVPSAKESYAEYAFFTYPTMADIADQGEDDFDLDLGDLALYLLPEESAAYTQDSCTSLSLFGVEATFPSDALVKQSGDAEVPIDHEQEIHVFEAPLERWDPPFVDVELDALYFLGPRWARLAGGGVPLSIEAPPGLEEGETAPLYLLGGFTSNWGDASVKDTPDFMYLDGDGACVNDNGQSDLARVDDGTFQNCGEVKVKNGRMVTPPLPRLTWVGVGR